MQVKSLVEGIEYAARMGYPFIVQPYFSLRGKGTAVVQNETELAAAMEEALALSPVQTVDMRAV